MIYGTTPVGSAEGGFSERSQHYPSVCDDIRQFITILYKLLIDRVPFLDSYFGTIWAFALVFAGIYVPLGVIIGYWHRKSQWTVEQEVLFKTKLVPQYICS